MNFQTSIQEAAAQFANTLLSQFNSAAAETMGVDVMWFRATPDKRSQDVIFQSYTLYGVEDCPLVFRAVYTDTGYDDGALVYNIMGLNYAIPMTLDIPLETWKTVTGNDGTIPQQNDIVFIPMTRKLLQVASMTPVKQVAGQLTSFKVNLEIYTPKRSRIVGENLKTSIKENTTNLDERFGDDIDEAVRDIVDDNQISKYTSTVVDEQKKVVPETGDDSIVEEVRCIESYNLKVDGHTVARNYYNMSSNGDTVVEYLFGDHFTKKDERGLSLWFRIKEPAIYNVKNLKGDDELVNENGMFVLKTTTGKKFKKGDNVILRRGKTSIPGLVIAQGKIRLNHDLVKDMNKINPNWYKMPGFTLETDNKIRLLSGDGFSISLKGRELVSVEYGVTEVLLRISKQLVEGIWYGIIVNISEDAIGTVVYSGDGSLEEIDEVSASNSLPDEITVNQYKLLSSYADITNIRLYNTINNEKDKQITDLLSYNARNDSHAIINDSADTFINKPYLGRQR